MSRSATSRNAGATPDLYCEIEGVAVTLRAEDLSTAGFFVETPTPYALDRELDIYVRSSVGELFACGQVVQVVDGQRARAERRRPGYGLLFTTLEDDQRAFIGLTLDALTRARVRAPKPKSMPPPQAAMATVAASGPTKDGAALEAIAAELRTELSKLQGKTAWTALGLEADAPLGRAKEAFLSSSKRFHPHKFARHDSVEITKLATEVFIAYKRAYDLLTKLAPRLPVHSQEAVRAPQRTPTSLGPTQATTSTRPAGGRPRSR